MSIPKIIYINEKSLNDVTLIPFGRCNTGYISLEHLKKWMEENNWLSKPGMVNAVNTRELLKYLNEE